MFTPGPFVEQPKSWECGEQETGKEELGYGNWNKHRGQNNHRGQLFLLGTYVLHVSFEFFTVWT
jgi:hypothetical protein